MAHLSGSVMKMKALVFAFAVVAFFAAVSSAQDFDVIPYYKYRQVLKVLKQIKVLGEFASTA
ncbi:hypothetical protein ACE6H2_011169 [Prunus campanulata]